MEGVVWSMLVGMTGRSNEFLEAVVCCVLRSIRRVDGCLPDSYYKV
jgi:hypothetical protein